MHCNIDDFRGKTLAGWRYALISDKVQKFQILSATQHPVFKEFSSDVTRGNLSEVG